MKTHYINAMIYRGGDPAGSAGGGFVRGHLTVENGRIACITQGDSAECLCGAERVVDLGGRWVVPGLVDVHVHLREPGYGYKETIATGTAAAARGGYTTVCPMPNLDPAPDSLTALEVQLEIIRRDAAVRVIPYGCITLGERCARLADFAALAPHVVGFSDDGRGVQSEAMMEEAMRRAAALDKPIVAHCEVEELLYGGYIHDGGYCRAHGHKGICSESEWRQVERDIALAEKTGCRYHVCHISTKESVELVRRAKARGSSVSCEATPHHLLLCDEDMKEDGRFKMNPPLRSRADRDALIAGILDGTIEIVATDHAPHTGEEKSRGLTGSAMGIVGLESAFGLLYTHLVLPGTITLEQLVALMSGNPRRIFRLDSLESPGSPDSPDPEAATTPQPLAAGSAADFTVLDLDTKYTIDPAEFLSKGRSTPFSGWQVQGRAVMTVVGGCEVYTDETMKTNR